MFTYELARRLEGSGVTANALHPSVVRANVSREHSTGWMRLLLNAIRPFLNSPERGAATSLYLASSPDVEGMTGRYLANSRPKVPRRQHRTSPPPIQTMKAGRLLCTVGGPVGQWGPGPDGGS